MKRSTIQEPEPEYDALSHVWGTEAGNAFVYTGVDWRQTVAITSNLDVAIRHLRDREECRTLWIDALCIDQSTLEEKSSQVTMMGKIFSPATSVILWLGSEAHASGRAFKMLHHINQFVNHDLVKGTTTASTQAGKDDLH
ncbi:hypothetical protein NX059_005206 [Plenodomus lindquistii]|nr:hypothetical protein NX059_005206 [Plenodomus lindquistii]